MAKSWEEWAREKKEQQMKKPAASYSVPTTQNGTGNGSDWETWASKEAERRSKSPYTIGVKNAIAAGTLSPTYGSNLKEWTSSIDRFTKQAREYYSQWNGRTPEADEQILSTLHSQLSHVDDWKSKYAGDEESLKGIAFYEKGMRDLLAYADAKYADSKGISGAYGVSDAVLQSKLKDTANPIAYTTSDGKVLTWAGINDSRELDKLYGMSTGALTRAMKLSDSDIAYTTSDGRNITWKSLYSQQKRKEDYEDFSSRPDWAENSMYRTTMYAEDTNFDDPNLQPVDIDYEMVNNPNALGESFDNDTYRSEWMTDEERQMFNYLYHTQGREAAFEWQQDLMNELEDRRAQDISGKTKDWASKSGWHSATAWAGARLASPLAGIEYVGDLVDSAFTGRSMRNDVVTRNTAVDQAITDPVDWNLGGWDAFDFGYSTATSGVDSILAGLLGKYAGGATLGLSAAAQATNAALDRGINNFNAVLTGLSAGAAEFIGESISIGKFKALQEVDPQNAKAILKNIWSSMMTNAQEESATEVMNIAADWFVNDLLSDDNFSEIQTQIRVNMQNGMDEKAATCDAFSSATFRILESGASGALMGVGFGAIDSTIGHARAANTAKRLYGSDPSALVTEALDIDPENEYAKKLQGREKLTGGQMAYLAKQNESALRESDKAKIKQAAVERLTELGATENVEAVADALAKQAAGEKLSKAEQRLLDRNRYAPQVAEELDPQNIKHNRAQFDPEWAETHSTEWAEGIETDRINAAEYSRRADADSAEQDSGVSDKPSSLPSFANVAQNANLSQTDAAEENVVSEAKENAAALKTADTGAEVDKVKAVSGKSMTFETAEGAEISIDEIAFASEGQERAYRAIAEVATSAENANALIDAYRASKISGEVFAKGVGLAYINGQHNLPLRKADMTRSLAALSAEARDLAYRAGQIAAGYEVEQQEAKLKQIRESAGNVETKPGKVFFSANESGGTSEIREHLQSSGRQLTEIQEASLLTMEKLSAAMGVDFNVFESYEKEDGKRYYINEDGAEVPAPNGFYTGGKIYIDLNAGNTGKGTMLFTVAHELTHFIKDWSPAKYKILADTVVGHLEQKKGVSAFSMMESKQATREDLSLEDAYEEVVADAMESMLVDGKVVEMMAEVKQKDQTLWQKIRTWFKNLAADLKRVIDAYKGVKPDSLEGRMVADMQDVYGQLQEIYAEALVEGAENFSATQKTKNTADESGGKMSYRSAQKADGLSSAEEMEAAGYSQEKIRQETGLFRSYDGKWRFEMDDSKLTLTDSIEPYTTLGELIVHDELFAAYPDMRRMPVIFHHLSNGKRGSYSVSFDEIQLNRDLMQEPEALKDVLIHEIQHAIQEREGFASGSNVRYWERRLKEGYDGRRLDARKKAQALRDEYDSLSREKPEFFKEMTELEKTTPNVPRGRIDWNTLEQIEDDPLEWQEFDAKREELEKKYGESDVFDFFDLSYRLGEAERQGARTASELYYETAGEIEARDVTSRRILTEEQRKRNRPDVDYRDAVFTEDDSKVMYSLREVRVPTREELDAKDPITVVDISKPQTTGTFAERRQQIMHRAQEIISKPYLNKDTNTLIFLTEKSYEHVFHNKGEIQIDAAEHLPEFIENAVLTHAESPEYGSDYTDAVYTFFAAARAKRVLPVKLKVKEYRYEGQLLPKNIRAYFDNNPEDFASTYDTVVLEVEEIKEDTSGSAGDITSSDIAPGPNMSSTIKVADLLDLVKGKAEKYAPKLSTRSTTAARAAKALERENARLKEDVQDLKDLVKLQSTLTHGQKFKPSTVEKMANLLMKDHAAKGETKELADQLTGLYEYIAKGEDLTWEDIQEQAVPAAEWLRDHMAPRQDPYAAEIFKELRGRRIRLSEGQKQEAAYHYGSYNDFRKLTVGNGIFTSRDDALSLEEHWKELSEMYPDIFPTDTRPLEMPRAYLEALDTLNSFQNLAQSAEQDMLDMQEIVNEIYDGYWRVSTLYTVSDKKQAEIEQLRSKHRDRMDALKESHAKEVESLKQQKKVAVRNLRDSRARAEMKTRIRKKIGALDKLMNHGTKQRNVKEELRTLADATLEIRQTMYFLDRYTRKDMIRNGVGVDLSDREAEWFRQAQAALEAGDEKKLENLMGKLTDVLQRERNRINQKPLRDLFTEISEAYRALNDPNNPQYIFDAYDADVYQKLVQLGDRADGTTVRDMTLEQLKALNDAYTMILTTIRRANTMFAENISSTREQMSEAAVSEIIGTGKKRGDRNRLSMQTNSYFWNNEKPVYAFERIGSDTMMQLYRNLFKGQGVAAADFAEAQGYASAARRKFGYQDWKIEKRRSFETETGRKFDLSLGEMMSVYAYTKRETAYSHLTKGGIVFASGTEVVKEGKNGVKRTYIRDTAESYQLSEKVLGEIVSGLTEKQKTFVDAMQKYLSTAMGAKGNEVSMKLYGVQLYGEENYFPMRVAPQFKPGAQKSADEKQVGQASLKNAGFTHSVVPNAADPIVIQDFMDVWADHTVEMSNYHGLVLPLEDFRRVWEYRSKHQVGEDSYSVKEAMQNAYGTAGLNYLNTLYQDLNGGIVSDSREMIGKKLVGSMKKASVFASASVVVQQPSAIGRAFAEVDPKYFAGAKVTREGHKAAWEQMKKYAPVAIIKEMGYFDTDSGRSAAEYLKQYEYDRLGDKAKAVFTDSAYRDELLSKAPAIADEWTWIRIWEAVKRETQAKRKDLKVNSEEFLRAAGDRFSEVIDRTQVYDSVLSRSSFMRSRNVFMSMVTSFMSEPTTTANMIESAVRTWGKGDKKKAAGIFASVFVSVLLNSALVSIVRAARDDDEDETYWEKYLASLSSEMLDGVNPLTYLPWVRDVWSMLQGYDVERADMSIFSDLVSESLSLVKACSREEKNWAQIQELSFGLLSNLANLFGLPIKNIVRDMKGAYNMFRTVRTDLTERDTTWNSLLDAAEDSLIESVPVAGIFMDEGRGDRLYDAIITGDQAYADRLKASYKDEDAVRAAVRKALREHDSRIRESAEAFVEEDYEAYADLLEEIIAEKHFAENDVIAAAKAEINAMTDDGAETESAEKAKAMFGTDEFINALIDNDADTVARIREDIISTAVQNGKAEDAAEESLRSSAKTELKKRYIAGTASKQQVVSSMKAIGAEDIEKTVNKWSCEVITGISYDDQLDRFRSGDLSVSQLANVLTKFGGMTSDEAKEKIVELSQDAYADGTFNRQKMVGVLINYGGLTQEKAELKLQYWDYKKSHPDTFVDDSWIEKYNAEVIGSGIMLDTYVEYRTQVKSITGEGKKERRMAVIDSMPISSEQKDTLYYSEGWAASTIHEAPWR